MSTDSKVAAVRPLYEIAREIRKEWGSSKVYFGAVPYLAAMSELSTMDDMYGLDSAKSIVLYFLANANTFKGEKAREIKKELKSMCAKKKGF